MRIFSCFKKLSGKGLSFFFEQRARKGKINLCMGSNLLAILEAGLSLRIDPKINTRRQ